MKISCKCITYGRVHLLEEALHSFLIQEDEDNELIIVNDYPVQELKFEHPRVKIYNLDRTFKTIGEKENYAIERCSGDIIAVWDDDDVAMSWHLSNIRKYWEEDTHLLHWKKAVFYNEPQISALIDIGNSGIVYSKKAWEAVGRSPIENAGGDSTFVKSIHALGRELIVMAAPPDEEVSWFYRWKLPYCYHQSGMGTDVPERKNVVLRNRDYVKDLTIFGKFPMGEIELKPHWRHPYDQMLKDYVSRVHSVSI